MNPRTEPVSLTDVPDTTPYVRLALALSLGAAVSLGITRFAYGLLLPPMREDLGWSYTLAGAMNTFNALGYLIGALRSALADAAFRPPACCCRARCWPRCSWA